jgi:hypothetical protein
MSVQVIRADLMVRCDFTSPLQCSETRINFTKDDLERTGWLFVNNTPYLEESKVYCPRHAKEVTDGQLLSH